MPPFPRVLTALCHLHMKRGGLIPLLESGQVWDSDETNKMWQK